MLLLRAVVRLLAMAWMLVIALAGLGVAAYCFDAVIALHSVRPDRLLHLGTVHHAVGHFLTQIAKTGPTAGLALLCGIGAILIGLIILLGLLVPRRRHIAVLASGDGMLTARPRALRTVARTLAGEVDGVTAVRRPRLRLSRRGTRGVLRLAVVRTATTDGGELERSVSERLAPIAGPFNLRPRVHAERGGKGERVQ